MTMADARLALQIAVFTLAALFHLTRAFLDFSCGTCRVAASTLAASLGFLLYTVSFALNIASPGMPAAKFLLPAGLWTLKLAVVLLYPKLGLRRLVVWTLATYLAVSYVALLLVCLQLCRPWEKVGPPSCGHGKEVTTFTALDVSGYILIMAVPICIWHHITHRTAIAALLLSGIALSAISIVFTLLQLKVMPNINPDLFPPILADFELSLAVITTSLPVVWLYFFQRGGDTRAITTTADESGKPPETPAEERELVTFDPRNLGVLPDSIHGSFRSRESTPTPEDEDWRESREAMRSDSGGYSVHRTMPVSPPPRKEIWENDLDASPRSPRSMGGS